MTDPTPGAEPTEEPTATTQTPQTEPIDPPEDGSELAREARSWRKKYQTSKSEAETLTASVTALQRQLVEHQIAGRVVDPADWWSQANVADLLAEDGSVDGEKVDAKIAEILTAKPHWAPKLNPAAAPASDVSGNSKIDTSQSTTSWSQLLNPKPKS